MKKYACSIVGALFMAVQAFAVDSGSVGGISERAQWDATHAVTVTHADLAAMTTSNTAYTLTNVLAISAGESCQFVAFVLDTAFSGASHTNGYTNSVALTVTDAGGTNSIMGSTEIHADSTEVWVKPGFIPSTLTYISALSTNSSGVSLTTTSTASVALMPAGNKYYSAANFVNVTLTPNDTPQALSAATAGKFRLFFRKVKSKD